MNVGEAVVQAIKLAILTIGYVFEQAKKHEELVAAALERRTLFERALVMALERMRIDVGEENRRVDLVDAAVDKKVDKTAN